MRVPGWIVPVCVLILAALAIWAWMPLPPPHPAKAQGRVFRAVSGNLAQRYYVSGQGPVIVLLPSLGRPASDFNALAARLHAAGYRTLAFDPPQQMAAGKAGKPDLFALAGLVETALVRHTSRPAVLVGHAFGNRVARAFASRYPERTRALILLAAGGKRPIAPPALKALRQCFDPALSYRQRTVALRTAFFARGNAIPAQWRGGWDRASAALQAQATAATPSAAWWAGGAAPILVIQGDADAIAPAADSSALLAAEFGNRVQVALVSPAGHALLPEQPDAIARAVLAFLQALPE